MAQSARLRSDGAERPLSPPDTLRVRPLGVRLRLRDRISHTIPNLMQWLCVSR
ncbi:hypothetical protein [Mastigocladopsis repens]|uniref:hypothetical protein n=1 Tax=Mastigocladopsis repens TaxID=221287 RepID=UPI0002FF7C84|nr:hypothetical protein [Mastigocladopsis repens]